MTLREARLHCAMCVCGAGERRSEGRTLRTSKGRRLAGAQGGPGESPARSMFTGRAPFVAPPSAAVPAAAPGDAFAPSRSHAYCSRSN